MDEYVSVGVCMIDMLVLMVGGGNAVLRFVANVCIF